MTDKRHITFLIRKHPESIGGVQRHSARLLDGLKNSFCAEKICWKGPEWGTPFYFPYFYFKSVTNGTSLVHCDDAVTALVGGLIAARSGKKVVATVHGLDVILPFAWYQRRLKSAFSRIDKIVCVSNATARQVLQRGLPAEKIEIIPNAAETVENRPTKSEDVFQQIETRTGIDLHGKFVLFSLGRPLRRKGFDWFATEILPYLPEDCVYVVAGPAPETPPWINSIGRLLGKENHRLLLIASGCDTIHEQLCNLRSQPRFFYLNGVGDDMRELLFAASDLFVMPNRTVPGDMEGFGIVALEAAIRGVPVIATAIEGITDAVIDGQNGTCVPEGDKRRMIEAISAFHRNSEFLRSFGSKAREFTDRRFASAAIHGRYKTLFENLIMNNRPRNDRPHQMTGPAGHLP